jgi:hypothetical protein
VRARVLLGVAAVAAAGLCGWALFGMRDAAPQPPAPAFEAASDGSSPRPEEPVRADASDRPAMAELAPVEIAAVPTARARVTGVPPPPPDALVAVRGRVVDAVSGEPVAGITMGLLSRRPRTCTVKTDPEGRFATGAELSSGVVSVAHVPDNESPRFSARWAIEPTSFLATSRSAEESAAAKQPPEVVLAARAPERELAVDVKLPDGGAAAGASVSLTWGHREPPGRFRADGRCYEETDDYGRARFALFGPDAWERSFRIEADHRGTLASDVLTLDPPLGNAPPVLGLHPGGLLRVRAANDEGRPVAGVSLWIEVHDESGTVRGRAGETDARGECVFTALRSGCYAICALHPSTGEEIRREVDLARGAQETVDVRLTLAGMRLRLAGTVLDEFGYPLPGVAVRAQAAGEAWVALTTGEGGRFEFWGRPCDGVLVSAGGGFQDDRYEPDWIAVPCGTGGLAVRRLAKLEERSWPLQALDRGTGDPVAVGRVTLYRADTRGNPTAQQSFTLDAGVVELVYKQRDDLFYAVDAPGYLREQGPLADLVASAYGSGRLRVELERGFDRRLEIKDRITRRGVPHAFVAVGGAVIGTCDDKGVVHVHADAWPASARVEGAGYAPVTWDPDAAGFPGDVIWLEPLRSGN